MRISQLASAVVRAGYFAATSVAAPVLGALFALTSRGRDGLAERLGDWQLPPGEYLWFHGASVGEIQGLLPILKRCRELFPEQRILCSTTSVTGRALAAKHADVARLLPFDAPALVRKATAGLVIRGFIFGETELWPALLAHLTGSGVPCALVNARLSDFTVGFYSRMGALFAETLRTLTVIAANDQRSFDRFAELLRHPSASPQMPRRPLLIRTGNCKFDTPVPHRNNSELDIAHREFLGGERGAGPVLVLGSIHPGEFELLRAALLQLLGSHQSLSLIIAPRHPERFEWFAAEIASLCAELGKAQGAIAADAQPLWRRRSTQRAAGALSATPVRVLLLDTLGELSAVYPLATVAYVGGSLVPLGGHNPLEAALCSVPVLMGPEQQNVWDCTAELAAAQALVTVRDSNSFEAAASNWLTDAAQLRAAAVSARLVANSFLGATQRVLLALSSCGVLTANKVRSTGARR